jgi:hypothetical protein
VVVVSPDRSRTLRRRAQAETSRAPKPSGFKRTSENTGEAEAQAAHESRRLSKLGAAEPRGFDWEEDCRELDSLSFGVSGARSGGLVEPLDLSDKSERLVAEMLAEDESRIDLEGRRY